MSGVKKVMYIVGLEVYIVKMNPSQEIQPHSSWIQQFHFIQAESYTCSLPTLGHTFIAI